MFKTTCTCTKRYAWTSVRKGTRELVTSSLERTKERESTQPEDTKLSIAPFYTNRSNFLLKCEGNIFNNWLFFKDVVGSADTKRDDQKCIHCAKKKFLYQRRTSSRYTPIASEKWKKAETTLSIYIFENNFSTTFVKRPRHCLETRPDMVPKRQLQ